MNYKRLKDLDNLRAQLREVVKLEAVARDLYSVELRASGQDDLKALCPFHKEDTPSFGIRKSKQLYNCFGCKAGGDVFKFVQDMDSVEHMDAIRKLAEYASFDLTPFQESYSPEERGRQELYNLNKDVAEYAQLQTDAVHSFGKARRIPYEILHEFGVGYTVSLSSESIPAADLSQAQSLQYTMVGKWDRRVCIPIRDSFGRIAGFRNKDVDGSSNIKIIGPSEAHPLEVPEIYGLFEARKHIRAAGYLILVEGECDVWQMVAHGFRNVAAMMGTKLNAKMLDALDKLSIHKLVIIPDNDEAGRKFARSVSELQDSRFLPKIAILRGNEKDPDECLLAHGDTVMESIIADAKYAFDYFVDRLAEGYDASRPTDKLDILHDARAYVAGTGSAVRELVVRRLATTVGLDFETVLDFYREGESQGIAAQMHNVIAERVVLKRMLLEEGFVGDALLSLKPEDFYLSRHRAVFEAIGKLYRKQETVNEDTVRTLVQNSSGEGAVTLFASILSDGVDISGADFMLSDLRDKAIRRDVQKRTLDASNQLGFGRNDAKEVVQSLVSDLTRSVVGGGARIVTAGQIVQERMTLMHSMLKAPNAIIGLDIGPDFPVLNATLHGLQRSRYIVMSAPSGVGKTALAGVLAKRVSVDLGIPSIFFSFETGQEALTDRLISNISGVESDKIITGYLTKEEVHLVHSAAERIVAAPLVITERGVEFEECLSIIRHDVLKRGTRVVFVDYMQLMHMAKADRSLRRDQELGHISRDFLTTCKDLDITIVAIAQQNREAVKAGSNEGTGIGESFKIYQDADVFITFREKTKEEMDADGPDKGNRRGKLAKNRHGKGGVEFNIMADLDVMRFYEAQSYRKPMH